MGKHCSIRLDADIWKEKTSFGKHLFLSVHRGASRCLDSSPVCTDAKRSTPLALIKLLNGNVKGSDVSCVLVGLVVKHSQERVAAPG